MLYIAKFTVEKNSIVIYIYNRQYVSHKRRMPSVFLLAQLREKLQVESLAEGRSCVTQGCSMQDTSGLKKNIELLVDALLLNIS